MQKSLLRDFIIVFVSSLILVSLLYLYTAHEEKVEVVEDACISFDSTLTTYKYGIPVDSFKVQKGIVKRNQNLSEILSPFHVDYRLIDCLAKSWDSIFDVRKIRTGNHYSAFCSDDSLSDLRYFVYEKNARDYVVFEFGDTVNVWNGQKEIELVLKEASGIIESSLWNAMASNNINRLLALELEDIYAWSVDFFGLQKGDYFKVIYDEQYVDSTSIGIGDIHVALFSYMDTVFYAFPFIQDDIRSFYDIEGNSLRKAFLKAPLKFSRISSRFSNSRLHPVLKIRRPHHGVDYAAPVGTPVHAIGDGKVIKAGWSGGAGRMIKIKHNSIYTTLYMHLSRFGKGIKAGTMVKQGDIIGYVGSSGLSTGPHLDFRFYKNGVPVDPLKVEAPPVEPVNPALKLEYHSLIKYLKPLIDEIELPNTSSKDTTEVQ
ncbi:MAG: metalloendopeptidase [Marinilabiliales bacterium]|nr:MAG: metalloendopeptidase [Marinilabiliales bacterium]